MYSMQTFKHSFHHTILVYQKLNTSSVIRAASFINNCVSKNFQLLRKCGYRTGSVHGNSSNVLSFSHRHHLDMLDGTAVNTFQSRILNYMRTNSKFNSVMPSSLQVQTHPTLAFLTQHGSTHEQLLFKLKNVPQNMLAQSIYLVGLQRVNLSSNEFFSLLPVLDDKCCSELDKMDRKDILMTLDALMYLLPHKLVGLKFFSFALSEMSNWVSSDKNLSIEDFIQTMFYVGLVKKSQRVKEIMKLSLHYIDQSLDDQEITTEELCILTGAIFKTSTKITSMKLLSKITHTIEKNMELLLHDPSMLLTLVKALRHAQWFDLKLLDLLACKIINDDTIKNFNFTAKAHLLALFAGALYSKFDIISFLVDSGIEDLKFDTGNSSSLTKSKRTSHLSVRPRSKDLSRFLWSVSYLNYNIQASSVEDTIIPQLSNRIKCREYIKNPEEFIDSLLSLWTLGFKPKSLVINGLSLNNVASVRYKNKIRYNSRLALLMTCINIETPHLLSNEHLKLKDTLNKLTEPNIHKHLQKRPLLKKVYDAVNNLSDTLGLSNVTCSFAIPHLHIAGIEANFLSEKLNIEVLDENVCLHGSQHLQGLMQLKLRLLKSFSNHVLIITGEMLILDSDNTPALYSFLEAELQKVSTTYVKQT